MKNEKCVLRGILVGDTKPSDVVLQNGRVVAVKRAGRGEADIGSATSIIGPTLFDIQVNGANGIDLQGDKVCPEDLRTLTDFLASRGVSHWLPTLVTGSEKNMAHGCRMMAEALRDRTMARAVPGIHLEGPYISPKDGPRGAHAKRHVRKPSLREFDRLLKAADGKITYVTLAPEVEGAVPFIKGLVKRGVVVSLGHHHGSPEDIARAVDAGAQLCTHLGNGLSGQINRHANPLWPQLGDDGLYASLIADMEHLPAEVLKIFVRAKSPERTILTSDCVHMAGLKPGVYDLAGQSAELMKSGRICLLGTEFLAGSSLMLVQALVNAVRHTDLTLAQAFASATSIPGKLFGLRHRFALPTLGKKADVLVLDIKKSRRAWKADVQAVFVNGVRKD